MNLKLLLFILPTVVSTDIIVELLKIAPADTPQCFGEFRQLIKCVEPHEAQTFELLQTCQRSTHEPEPTDNLEDVTLVNNITSTLFECVAQEMYSTPGCTVDRIVSLYQGGKALIDASFEFYRWHAKYPVEWEYDAGKNLLCLKQELPHARLISGSSELAIELKFRFIHLPAIIDPRQVKELHARHLEENGVYMGTGMDLTDMDDCVVQLMKELPKERTEVLKHVHEMLHWFASIYVRKVASVAGNIATAPPSQEP